MVQKTVRRAPKTASRGRGRPRAFEPETALAQAMDVFWSDGFAATSLDDISAATGLNRPSLYGAFGDKTPPEVKAWAINKYAPRLAYLDAKLKDREFLLDRFSVADGYLTTVLNWTRATPEIDLSVYPNVKAYLERMRARPSVAAALATEIPLFQAEVARRKAA